MEHENQNLPSILVIDDDQAMLQAASQMLSLRMPETKADLCDNVQDALELIDAHDYDVIVSDIKMPGMDGIMLLAKVQERRPETPTILITGHGEHNLAIQALRGGAYDYILKPIDRDAFTAALRRALMARQLRRQVVQPRTTGAEANNRAGRGQCQERKTAQYRFTGTKATIGQSQRNGPAAAATA